VTAVTTTADGTASVGSGERGRLRSLAWSIEGKGESGERDGDEWTVFCVSVFFLVVDVGAAVDVVVAARTGASNTTLAEATAIPGKSGVGWLLKRKTNLSKAKREPEKPEHTAASGQPGAE
jgi:hypothetical protein